MCRGRERLRLRERLWVASGVSLCVALISCEFRWPEHIGAKGGPSRLRPLTASVERLSQGGASRDQSATPRREYTA